MNIIRKEEVTVVLNRERMYRALERDSYSTLRRMSEGPLSYYKKVILKEVEEQKMDSVVGSLVDCILLSENELDDRFLISRANVPNEGTQMHKYVKELYRLTKAYTENGVLQKDFIHMMEDAYNNLKFDRDGKVVDFKRDSFESVVNKFEGTDNELWYKELIESDNKTVVPQGWYDLAEKIASTIKGHKHSSDLFDGTYEVLTQVQILFEIDSLPMKSMLDMVKIDHKRKEITVIDLKVSWDILNWERKYVYDRYYIQNGVYTKAIGEWMKTDYSNYSLVPMKFLVGHSLNQVDPVIYCTREKDYWRAMSGFAHRGVWCPGVHGLVTNIKWAKENNIYTRTRLVDSKKGQIELGIEYD